MCQWLMVGAWVAAAIMGSGTAVAQSPASYPEKPVKMIVPFGAGSATDILARIIGDELRVDLGQNFLVDNRAGANGFIAAEAVAKAPADGYTLFVTSSTTQSINPGLFKKLPYDPVKDFAPIGGIMQGYFSVVINNDLPVNTLQELIALLRADSNKTSYGWGAAVSQISGAALLKRIGATATGVPYKSSPQVILDLIGGRLTFVVLDVSSAQPHIRANRLKALAVTSPKRIPEIPAVPTMAEAGLPGFEASAFVGMFAPAATPEPIVRRLGNALQVVLKKPAIAQKLTDCCSATVFSTTPAEFAEYLRKDKAFLAERIVAAGIEAE